MTRISAMRRILTALYLFIWVSCFANCGGGCGANPNPNLPSSSVEVSVFPPTVTLGIGASQQFTANVSGAQNMSVSWSVEEGAVGGTVSQSGLFTASNTTGTYHVIATSAANPVRSGSASATVEPLPPIAISPASNYLKSDSTCTFLVIPNMAVTWSIAEGTAGGSISATGKYTAPSALGTYHVTAQASGNPNDLATATVTVLTSGFSLVGSMATPRAAHTATLLPDGKVLVLDGGQFDIDDLLVPITGAEIYDPSSGSFGAPLPTTEAREFHTATLLQNGKVLITGGGSDSDTSAELYDPATGEFKETGSMVIARQGHTGTLLPDGRVLIVGGSSTDLRTEIYDPATENFSITGSLSALRSAHTATLLPNGKVLIVGGKNDLIQSIATPKALATTEIYDPQSGTFSLSGSMTVARTGHTATLLGNGKVFVAGGANTAPLASTEIYDPSTGQVMVGPTMAIARVNHTATLLGDGTILLVGGIPALQAVYTQYSPTSTAEIYDAASGTFSQTGSMSDGRFWHTATLLSDGRVLVVGGGHSDAPQSGSDSIPTAEVY
jgi:WD40 repeat protein